MSGFSAMIVRMKSVRAFSCGDSAVTRLPLMPEALKTCFKLMAWNGSETSVAIFGSNGKLRGEGYWRVLKYVSEHWMD